MTDRISKRPLVLLNARSGVDAGQAEHVRELFLAHRLDVEVQALPGASLARAAGMALKAGVPLVVAAGGDGTISTVAGVLAGTGVPLGILPRGTANHFARDLGIPLEEDAAVRLIVSGHRRQVDVAEVNGRVFINNSSIGLHPEMDRDSQQQERLGRSALFTAFFAVVQSMRRFPVLRVGILDGGRWRQCASPFVFVGNNHYELGLLSVGARARLDAGKLSLYIARDSGRFGMLILALRALLGRLEQTRDFESVPAGQVRIDSRKRRLRVACDGEWDRMTPPLHYRIRPGSLTVIAPPTITGT